MFTNIKRRPSDTVFSTYIRKRDGRCVLNRKCYKGVPRTIQELHCAHFHSRRKESVRFDPENAVALCPACHIWVDSTVEGKIYFRAFMEERLGTKGLAMLDIRAEHLKKRDDVLDMLYCKQLLSELEQNV